MVDDLRDECRSKGVEILLQETQLTAEEIDQSNSVLINGQPIEDILPQTRISQNSCCSCSNLIGHATTCRSLVHFEEEHEAIPSRLIREAVCHIARCC